MHYKSNIFTGLVVSIIVLAFCFCAYAENDLSFKVPLPPNTKLLDTKELHMGGRQINTALYASDEGADAITEYYRNFFQQQEFQKIMDKPNAKTKKQLLRFKKDELVVSIAIMVKPDKTEIVVARYLEPAGELPLEKIKPSVKDSLFALPKQDLPGKDLAAVPRPPESVRMMRRAFGASTTIMYTTSLDVEATADFYRLKMPNQEWTLTNETAVKKAVEAYEETTGKKSLGIESPFSDGEDFQQLISDSYVLSFIAGSATARITIFPNFIDRKLGSMVQIVYSEKP